MDEGEKRVSGPFDVKTIKYLVRLMGRHDLTEVDLREGEQRIRLRRGPKQRFVQEPVPAAVPAVPIAGPPAAAFTAPAVVAKEGPAKHLVEIKSPTPGTFYTASSPEAEPFVKVGSRVQPNTVVCIIEAMKVFNEITADCTGTIVAIETESQQAVEYGQVLFKVDPTG